MDRELVTRAIAGDREAFSELIRRSVDRLYAVAQLILRDSVAADDATQEALVAAWRDLSALRDPDRFDAWIHRVLVRACYLVDPTGVKALTEIPNSGDWQRLAY